MKKQTLAIIVLLAAATSTITSCQKSLDNPGADASISLEVRGPLERAWFDTFANNFGFVPDIDGGWTPPNPAPAWYPGEGTGSATHMGAAVTYFNQKALFGPGGLISIPQPVTMFYSTQLAALGITGVPSNVSSVVADSKGNSVWFESQGSTTTPVSPTRVEFTAQQNIVGGTGKFAAATGSVTLKGYFNPTNPADAASGNRGRIIF